MTLETKIWTDFDLINKIWTVFPSKNLKIFDQQKQRPCNRLKSGKNVTYKNSVLTNDSRCILDFGFVAEESQCIGRQLVGFVIVHQESLDQPYNDRTFQNNFTFYIIIDYSIELLGFANGTVSQQNDFHCHFTGILLGSVVYSKMSIVSACCCHIGRGYCFVAIVVTLATTMRKLLYNCSETALKMLRN